MKFRNALFVALLVLASIPCVTLGAESRIAPSLEDLKKAYSGVGDDSAVVLSRNREFRADDDGEDVLVAFQAILLLDDQAVKDYGLISISFNSYYEEISLDFAQLVEEDGQVHSISPDAIQVQSRGSGATYDDIRYLVFSLPRINKNSVIEYQYRIRSKKPVIDGHWYERISFQGGQKTSSGNSWRFDAVANSEVSVRISANSIIRHSAVNSDIRPVVTNTEKYTRYHWTLKNLPEVIVETGMQTLSERIPFLEISSIPDWATIDAWASRWYLPEWSIQDGMDSIVGGNDVKQASMKEVVRAVFDYTQGNIRYVEADVMRGGFLPHAPNEVMNKRYGDCKDQSVFIAAVLRSKGIKAFPALVSIFPEYGVIDEVPSLHFSHSIVYIDDGSGSPMFLDTSGETGVFPGLDWSLEGMRAFVIDGNGGRLLTVPLHSANDNLIRVNLDYRFEDDDVNVNFDIRIDGPVGNHFGTWLENDVKENLELITKSIFSGSKLVDAREGERTQDTPFHVLGQVKYENSWEDSQAKVALEGGILSTISTFTDTLPMLSPEKRMGDYYVYLPYSISYTARVYAPQKGYKSIVTNPGVNVEEGLYSIRQHYSNKGNRSDLQLEFSLRRGYVLHSEYKPFYSKLDQALTQAAQWKVVFLRDKSRIKEGELARDAGNSDDPAARVRLARHYLDVGEYEKALSESQKAVDSHPDFGEAYYVLGISYGFMEKDSMSRNALDKARSLGYRF